MSVFPSLSVQHWALHIPNNRTFYRELTYSLITMRAVVVRLDPSSSVCSCSDMYSLCALGSQPPPPQRAALVFFPFPRFPCAWTLRGNFHWSLIRKITAFYFRSSSLENKLCNKSTLTPAKSAGIPHTSVCISACACAPSRNYTVLWKTERSFEACLHVSSTYLTFFF